ncbi:MAG: prolyl oligopeptidase family serine peptidase [Planctomycetales bacterium]
MKSQSLFVVLAIGVASVSAQLPDTPRRPVADVHHGETLADDYRWLEDGSDPEVKRWSESQDKHARKYLRELPDAAAVRERVAELLGDETVSYWGVVRQAGLFFAMKRQPPKQQPFLIVRDGDQERILVDPGNLDAEAGISIVWFVPSPSGKWVAVSLSEDGDESGDVFFYETKTGKRTFEKIPRVNGGTAGGDLAWAADEQGVFYTRYPRGTERPPEDMNFFQQLYHHKFGTAAESDRYELRETLPRIAEIQLTSNPRSGRLLATVQDGDGGEFVHFLRSPDGKWKQFSEFGDKHVQAAFGPRDDLYVVSLAGTPRGRILRMPIKTLDLSKAEVVVEQGQDAIVTDFWGPPTVLPTANRLFVTYQLGGPSEIRVFSLDGEPRQGPASQEVASVDGLTAFDDDRILFRVASFLKPSAWQVFDPNSGAVEKTDLSDTSSVHFNEYRAVREFAVSKDGTKVPLTILMPKDESLKGPFPCLVTGYGGYGHCVEPRFNAVRRAILEQGMIFVAANLRGGGEYGEDWRRQGNLANKQNVFDDFAGVLQHLIRKGHAQSSQLVIEGGSNGGLLMGAVTTQHPELMKATVAHVGIFDMLRFELSPNGAFNVPEFGTVKNESHYRAMKAYSPYHHVVDGQKYPPVLFLTGANDPRVDPMHSRKMTARLQAATSSDAPILLRTVQDAGHGAGTPLKERIAQTADVLSFMFHQLNIEYRRPE